MKVKRINLEKNVVTNFDLGIIGSQFLVKNFTDSYIEVCLGDFNEDETIKIPSMTFEVISDSVNEDYVSRTKKTYSNLTIKSEVGGEVEVRCIR